MLKYRLTWGLALGCERLLTWTANASASVLATDQFFWCHAHQRVCVVALFELSHVPGLARALCPDGIYEARDAIEIFGQIFWLNRTHS